LGALASRRLDPSFRYELTSETLALSGATVARSILSLHPACMENNIRPACSCGPFQMTFSFLIIGAAVGFAILALAAVLIFVSQSARK
jgi:hypothetical protein